MKFLSSLYDVIMPVAVSGTPLKTAIVVPAHCCGCQPEVSHYKMQVMGKGGVDEAGEK